MQQLLRRIIRLGKVTEELDLPEKAISTVDALSTGSIKLRHVDCGSCNGCEVELSMCFSPIYDLERFGVSLTASPRHADGLLVTGIVAMNMKGPLIDAHRAVPSPKVVIAVGDCACDGGSFSESYAHAGSCGDYFDITLKIPGCPPEPSDIIRAIRRISAR